MFPSQRELVPLAALPLSMMRTESPARAQKYAAAAPTAPAPMMITSLLRVICGLSQVKQQVDWAWLLLAG